VGKQLAQLIHRSLLRRANVGYGGPRAAYDRWLIVSEENQGRRGKSGSYLHFPHLSGCANRVRGQKDRRYVGRYDTSHKKTGYGGQPSVLVSPLAFLSGFDQSIQEMS